MLEGEKMKMKRIIGFFLVSTPFIGIACMGFIPTIPWWIGLAILAASGLLTVLVITGIRWGFNC